MLDGLILQIVLTALVVIAAVVLVVWFVWGIKEKSATWIIALSVPIGVITSLIPIILCL